MSERSRVLGATLIGSAIGGAIGYLYFTDDGRRLRNELEPKLDQLAAEFRKLRRTLSKAQEVAIEGWRSVNELTSERPSSGRWPAESRQRTDL
jgi:gas vesicle protein